MKREKIKYILLTMLIGITVAMPQAYAKTSIEIKPNASTVYTNITISECFDESMKMKDPGEGLEGSEVDVHMATNTDWAIVSYFSNSAYGTNGEGKNTGVTTSINGKNYFSTNGNITGVLDFGKTYTYTSGIISDFVGIEEDSTQYSNGRSIIAYATNKKYEYVDLINTVLAKDMAQINWYGNYFLIDNSKAEPYSMRKGLFGVSGGGGNSLINTDGSALKSYTFRPVIWN